MAEADANAVIRQHLRRFFAWYGCEEHQWTLGPAVHELPRLRVAEFAPGRSRGCGMSPNQAPSAPADRGTGSR
jgi:hypothetical protein